MIFDEGSLFHCYLVTSYLLSFPSLPFFNCFFFGVGDPMGASTVESERRRGELGRERKKEGDCFYPIGLQVQAFSSSIMLRSSMSELAPPRSSCPSMVTPISVQL